FATRLGKPASLPLGRLLAPLCVGVTGLFVVWLAVEKLQRKNGPRIFTDETQIKQTASTVRICVHLWGLQSGRYSERIYFSSQCRRAMLRSRPNLGLPQ